MAPKKKETTKLSLGEFLTDSFGKGSSWADEVEETYVPTGTQQLPPARDGSRLNSSSSWQDRGYSVRDSVPSKIPDKPPYTAHLGNLSYDATNESLGDFFDGCDVVSVRIIEDREMMRPRGFGYVEFGTVEGLKKALTLDGQSFEGRMIKIKVADPPRGGDGRPESSRDLSDWSRKGPLPDLPGRSGPRQAPDFGERRAPRDSAAEPRPVREFNWERRGPLSPLTQEPAGAPRDSSRSRPATGGMGERSDSFRGNRADPAAWGGEGREDRPRREFTERPERPERVPTAAEKDMRWRERMRPDPVVQAPAAAEAPETPTSPVVPAAPAGRPRLALTKRTVTESTEPTSTPSDSKASPFGAARPIDTAARERQVEEKRQQQLQEKREADEKAKEEKRLAKEAAAKEAAAAEAAAEAAAAEAAVAEAAAAEEAAAKEAAAKEAAVKEAAAAEAAAAAAAAKVEADAEAKQPPAETAEVKSEAEKSEATKQNGAGAEQKLPVRNREPREFREPKEPRDFSQAQQKSRAAESGNWRSASNEQRNNRGPPGGPRGGRNGGHGGRGGPRNDNRTPRSNGASGQEPAAAAAEPEAATVDEDGWTTVPNKKGRAGRPLMS